MFDPAAMAAANFTYVSIGRPTSYPVREAVAEPVAVGS
jgi:hypothetical protein